ncbi:hypothetical protein D3C85_1442510 [compost metagenome]
MLGRAGFFDKTHSAVDLHAERSNVDGILGAPALDHRDHQVDEGLGGLALCKVVVTLGTVHGRRHVAGQGAHAFGARFH